MAHPEPVFQNVEGAMDYNLIIIIGGGTAGMNAMKAAHSLDAKVAIAEEKTFAGTCLTSG
jgi:pyruvate/2-oxoglutarate dehydrogenase complex dihydrolipoamide dehydrogenase (E3) component